MDVKLIESGNGGDLVLTDNDLAVVGGVENMPYLSMFGGANYWANQLLLSDPTARTFDALTETALNNNPLSSAGRVNINTAVAQDIAFLGEIIPGTTITTDVILTGDNRCNITVTMNGEEINMLWNPSADTITIS